MRGPFLVRSDREEETLVETGMLILERKLGSMDGLSCFAGYLFLDLVCAVGSQLELCV